MHAFIDPSSTDRGAIRTDSTLLDYATANWSTHYRMAEFHDQMLAGLLQNSITKKLDVNHNCSSIIDAEWDNQVRDTMLRICASQGLVTLTRMYMEMGTRPNGDFCTYCDTPLHLASAQGHADIVAVLVKYGASVFSSTRTRGETALHLAAAHGSLETMQILLENNAAINATDSVSKRTALHAAAAFGHLNIVKFLMGYDVDVNAALPQTKETPLHLAVLGGHVQVVRYMLGGVSPSGEELALYDSIVHKPYFQMWSESILTGYDNNGIIRLDGRLIYDEREDVQKLLSCSKKYADINMSTREGWTALHLAAIRGHDVVLQLLISHGADLAAKGNDQRTPLDLAAENGHLSTVKHLIAAGADLNADASRRGSMLRHIAEKGYHEIADLLLWKKFITKIAGETRKWPVLHLATLSPRHMVQDAMNRKRHTDTSKRPHLEHRPRF